MIAGIAAVGTDPGDLWLGEAHLQNASRAASRSNPLNDVAQTVRVGGTQAGQDLDDGSELRVAGRGRFDRLGG